MLRICYRYKSRYKAHAFSNRSNLASRQPKQNRHLALILLPIRSISPLLLGALLQQRHTRRVIQQHVGECRREEREVGEVSRKECSGTGGGGFKCVVPNDGQTAPEGDFTGVTDPKRQRSFFLRARGSLTWDASTNSKHPP